MPKTRQMGKLIMNIEEKILSYFKERQKLLEWFNNDEQNQELLKLYNSKNEVIKEIKALNEELKCGELSLLLPSIPPNYEKSKYKIMVIGQELNGGFGIRSEPRITMLDNLKGQTSKSSGGGFFSFPAKLCHAVNEIGGKLNRKKIRSYFVWAEIRKFLYYKKVGSKSRVPRIPLNAEVQNLIDRELNILEDEIKIINPDIVLFLIGPSDKYKEVIEKQLNGVKFHKFENFEEKELAKVEHPILEGRKAFRIYHPTRFRFIKKEISKKYLEELIKECKK